jgi:hypothetical protein
MNPTNRFQDENLVLADFYDEVWVLCPACAKKAIAKRNAEEKTARLFCVQCGYNKEVSTAFGKSGSVIMAANGFFDSELWLTASFKNEIFWAYNAIHLHYLERYIGAHLREHKDRTHFTLLEKLPKFYHDARNREGLLKVIEKLKSKG